MNRLIGFFKTGGKEWFKVLMAVAKATISKPSAKAKRPTSETIRLHTSTKAESRMEITYVLSPFNAFSWPLLRR